MDEKDILGILTTILLTAVQQNRRQALGVKTASLSTVENSAN